MLGSGLSETSYVGAECPARSMGLSPSEYAALTLLTIAIVVVAIVLILKVIKFIFIAAVIALIGYAFYAGWIHI